MKTKLALALCAAMLVSTAAMAAQSDDQSAGTMQTTKTTTTTTTTKHLDGANATWYKEGGVVPVQYRGNTYVVEHWKTEHLNEPAAGSHWVRGDNGDFLLVNEDTGAITRIVHQH